MNKHIYNHRIGIVEPVFGIIQTQRKFTKFLVKNIKKVKLQWKMVCSAFNLNRLYSLKNAF